jgi:hypothetical protein
VSWLMCFPKPGGMQVLFSDRVLELLARWSLSEASYSCWRFGCGVTV